MIVIVLLILIVFFALLLLWIKFTHTKETVPVQEENEIKGPLTFKKVEILGRQQGGYPVAVYSLTEIEEILVPLAVYYDLGEEIFIGFSYFIRERLPYIAYSKDFTKIAYILKTCKVRKTSSTP